MPTARRQCSMVERNRAPTPGDIDVCPRLGTEDDEASHSARAGPWRRCYHWRLPAAVSEDHQERFCLTARHRECPRKLTEPDPAGLRMIRRAYVAVATIVILVMGCLIFATATPLSAKPQQTAALVANTIESTPTPTPIPPAVAPPINVSLPKATAPAAVPPPLPTATTVAMLLPPASTPTPLATAVATTQPTLRPTSTPTANPGVFVPSPTRPAPTPTAKPTVAPPAARTHVVASGQTLYSIARMYGVSVQAIVEANGLGNRDYIEAGQVLEIPAPVFHVVAAGQSLTAIASIYGVTVEAIVEANGLANRDYIEVGQVLLIPR